MNNPLFNCTKKEKMFTIVAIVVNHNVHHLLEGVVVFRHLSSFNQVQTMEFSGMQLYRFEHVFCLIGCH